MDIGYTIPVLDHGYVKLIGSMGTEESIIEAARMSTNRGFERWDAGDVCDSCGWYEGQPHGPFDCDVVGGGHHLMKSVKGDASLLEYLYKNRHMTPFEMCELHIEVKAPIMVFREWHRHRTWSYNEMSARYVQMPNEHYLPLKTRIQKQDPKNKQGSAEYVGDEMARDILTALELQQGDIYTSYEDWVDDGVAKEIARLNTPVSRYSKMRAKTDLRNVLSFLLLRKDKAAQWKIRQYADALGRIVEALWPRVWELFLEYSFESVSFSRSEMQMLKEMVGAVQGFAVDNFRMMKKDDRVTKELFRKLGLSGGLR